MSEHTGIASRRVTMWVAVVCLLLGPMSPGVARDANFQTGLDELERATLNAGRGDAAAAEGAYRRAIDALERAVETVGLPANLKLVDAYFQLAKLQQEGGRKAEALKSLTGAIENDEVLVGADAVPVMLQERAELALELGETEMARADFTRIARRSTANAGSRSAVTAQGSLAVIAFVQGDLAGAASVWSEVVAARIASLGESAPSVAWGLREVAALQTMAGDDRAADASRARADRLSAGTAIPRTDPAPYWLISGLAELIDIRLPERFDASNRVQDCERAQLWLRMARLYAAGPDPKRASTGYHHAMESLPGGAETPNSLPLLEEQIEVLEALGETKSAGIWRNQAALLRRLPVRDDIPACPLE